MTGDPNEIRNWNGTIVRLTRVEHHDAGLPSQNFQFSRFTNLGRPEEHPEDN
jgi:hypothetical protein